MVGHSDQFISSLSPLDTIGRPPLTAIMKLSVTKRWQLQHPVNYLKVGKSPTQHHTSLAAEELRGVNLAKRTEERFTARKAALLFSNAAEF